MLLNVNKFLKKITLSYSPLPACIPTSWYVEVLAGVRISSDYKNPYLFSNRMLHKNSVLHANNPAGFNLGQGPAKPLTAFPLNRDAEKILLRNLNELRANSQQATVFEYLQKMEVNFERSIPMTFLIKYNDFLSKNWDDLARDTANKLSIGDNPRSSILRRITRTDGSLYWDKWYNFYRSAAGNTDKTNTNDKDIVSLSNSINQDYLNIMPNNTDSGNLIEIKADGQIMIDPTKFSDFTVKLGRDLIDKLSKMDLESIQIYLYGFGTIWAYKGIVWVYDKGDKMDLSSFNTDSERFKALKYMQRNRFLFTTCGALGVLAGIHCILYIHKRYIPSTVNVSVNVNTTSSNPQPQNSLLFLLTYFKKLNTWLKISLIIILIPIIYSYYPYISYLYVSYVNFINNNYFQLQLLICLIGVLIILYFILNLYFLNKYSTRSEAPILSKYLPSFVRNEILSLYELSQMSNKAKSVIIGHTLKTIIAIILVYLFVLATLLSS